MIGFQLVVDVGVRVVGIHGPTSGEIHDHRGAGSLDVEVSQGVVRGRRKSPEENLSLSLSESQSP